MKRKIIGTTAAYVLAVIMVVTSVVSIGTINAYAASQREDWYDIATNVDFASNHVFLDTAPDSFYVRGMPNVTDIRHISEATFTVQAGTSIVIYLNRIDYGIEQAIHFAISNALQGDETHLVRFTATGFTYIRRGEWDIDGRYLRYTFAAPGEYRFWRPGGWTRNFVVVEAIGTQTPVPPTPTPTPQATPAPTATPLPQGTGNIRVTVDGSLVVFDDVQPQMVGSRVLVPVRGVFEYMGFDVDWISETRTATLDRPGVSIVIPANGRTFTVNNEVITPDVPQQMINRRLMLPLRAVAEAVGGTADWDRVNRIAVITTQGQGAVATPTPSPIPTPVSTPTPTPPAVAPSPTPTPPSEREVPFLYTQSTIQIPNRRLTTAERQAWIDEYRANGGASAFELEVIRLVNEERAARGLNILQVDNNLMMAARFYTQTLSNLNLPLGHGEGPYGGSGGTAEAFGDSPGWRNGMWGVWTPEDVVGAWMNSPAHRDNMLRPSHTRIGFGSYLGGQWGVFHYAYFNSGQVTPIQ